MQISSVSDAEVRCSSCRVIRQHDQFEPYIGLFLFVCTYACFSHAHDEHTPQLAFIVQMKVSWSNDPPKLAAKCKHWWLNSFEREFGWSVSHVHDDTPSPIPAEQQPIFHQWPSIFIFILRYVGVITAVPSNFYWAHFQKETCVA